MQIAAAPYMIAECYLTKAEPCSILGLRNGQPYHDNQYSDISNSKIVHIVYLDKTGSYGKHIKQKWRPVKRVNRPGENAPDHIGKYASYSDLSFLNCGIDQLLPAWTWYIGLDPDVTVPLHAYSRIEQKTLDH